MLKIHIEETSFSIHDDDGMSISKFHDKDELNQCLYLVETLIQNFKDKGAGTSLNGILKSMGAQECNLCKQPTFGISKFLDKCCLKCYQKELHNRK